MDKVTFITSEKLKKLIVINGYKFRFHKTLNKNVQRWTCCKNSCTAHLKLDEDNNIIDNHSIHNHEQCDEKTLTRQNLSNTLKRKAVEDITCKPAKLLHSELKNGDMDSLTNNDMDLIRRNIHYARSRAHGLLPKSRDETHSALNNTVMKTNCDEDFMFINDVQNSIVGFSTEKNLKVLCDVHAIYMDGTFSSCPKYFLQLFTIHGFHDNVYIPLVYFLLPDKEKLTYTKAFSHLMDYCEGSSVSFTPIDIFVDFELAIHIAVKEVWPRSQLKGCRFHLGQSWWRQIQKLGLSKEYQSHGSEISNFLKNFFGLPFLHPEEVLECVTEDFMSIQPEDDKRIYKFLDYVFKNYVCPEEALFPPSVWANFSGTINRTTNSCESFHSKLNGMFCSKHPNIFTFINVLLGVQNETYIKIRSTGTKTSKTIQDKEKFLRERMIEYKNNSISRMKFVQSTSLKFLPLQL